MLEVKERYPLISLEWAKQVLFCLLQDDDCCPDEFRSIDWATSNFALEYVTTIHQPYRAIIMESVNDAYWATLPVSSAYDEVEYELIYGHMLYDSINKEIHHIGYGPRSKTIVVWVDDKACARITLEKFSRDYARLMFWPGRRL